MGLVMGIPPALEDLIRGVGVVGFIIPVIVSWPLLGCLGIFLSSFFYSSSLSISSTSSGIRIRKFYNNLLYLLF